MKSIEEILSYCIIDANTECWHWTRGKSDGYGYVNYQGKQHYLHRLIYEHFISDIPKGLDIDHKCRNRDCCNPEHLEPVTRAINVLRGTGIAAENARKEYCSNGHVFDEANTYIIKPCKSCPNGGRYCRKCNLAGVLAYQERSKNKIIERRFVKTECKYGHRYTSETTYYLPSGKRRCRTCGSINQKNYQSRKKSNETG